MTLRIVVIASTGGSVLNGALAASPWFRDQLVEVVSDRPCGAIAVARRHGVASHVEPAPTGPAFSDALADRYADAGIDLFVSFYTRLFGGRFLEQCRGRLVNVHPSLLPAAPGLDGFGDTVRSGATFIGSTVHFVDAGVDTGLPIVQAARPFDAELTLDANRHHVYVQQCRMLIQVARWMRDGRVAVCHGRVRVRGGRYVPGEFAPNLDFEDAIGFPEGE